MSMKKYRMAFRLQKHHAAQRGIGWELTFEQWMEWWGDDIERRGRGPNDLQMQRFGDVGPYALGNIRKGTPKQNSATRIVVLRNRQGIQASQKLEERREAAIEEESRESRIDDLDEDEQELLKMFGFKSSMSFMRNS